MTQLHAGGKFDQNSYKVSGGLHGVGVSVVNALSVWLKLRIWRDGKEHFMEFSNGDAVADLIVTGPAPVENGKPKRGTEVTFLPSSETFTMVEFDYATIEHRLRELAFLNSGVHIVLTDARHAEIKQEDLFYEGGLEAFVRYLDRAKSPLISAPIMVVGKREHIAVEVALWWNDSYHENVLVFTNNIPQRDGGTHLAGFRAALTRQITGYAESSGISKREKVDLTGDDCREGLTCVVSVKVPDPKFSSQTKDKLVSSEVRPAVESIVNEMLGQWLEEHPADAKTVVSKVAKPPPRARRRARRETSRGARARSTSPTCPASSPIARSAIRPSPNSSSSRATSAGGTAKQGRNREYQAVLPLRGKILNVERARFDKMLASRADRHADHRARRRHRPRRVQHREAALSQDHHHDRRRRRRRAYPNAAADLLLPADAGADRARPCLYRAAAALQGEARQVEQYLKDERALEDYLIDALLDGAVLRSPSGEDRAGADLRKVLEDARAFRYLVTSLHSRYDNTVVEQAAIAGALQPLPQDAEEAQKLADKVAQRLDVIAEETERGWRGAPREGGYLFRRTLRGVEHVALLDAALLASSEASKLTERAEAMRELFDGQAILMRRGDEASVSGPIALYEAMNAQGRKGLAIQRYKGLGEMNAEQLWETTLDRDARSLLQVKIKDLVEADDIFVKLMGDIVEPRREFIQENALSVANLDV